MYIRVATPAGAHLVRRGTMFGGLVMAASAVWAAPIDFGNEDLTVNWDNTLKYSAGMRARRPNAALIDAAPPLPGGALSPNPLGADDGNRNFKRGSLISNRVDLLSEFDISYRGTYGLRVSGAAWYDAVYNRGNANNSPATNNALSVPYNEFTEATRQLHGKKAEILDAFVFGAADIGATRLSVRAGRHTLLWGESLFFGNNGLAGAQAPVDAVKGSSVPGSTTKELLMPVGQVSATLQLGPVALMAYSQYAWERSRLPAVGSYFSVADLIDAGGERALVVPGVPGNGLSRAPDLVARDSGQGGIGLRSRIGQFDIGVYALRFHAKTPMAYLRPGVPTGVSGASLGQYQMVFPQGIRAYGASTSTSVGPINLAAEASVRRRTPLTSNPQVVPSGGDNDAHPYYAVGNSAHAQVSLLWTMPGLFLSSEPSLSAEIAANRMTSCELNCTPSAANAFRSSGALDPNATRNAYAARISFNFPQRNVLDGLDLTPSVSVSRNHGRSSVVVFGADRGGDATLSMGANYIGLWDFTLAYTYYYGKANTSAYLSSDPKRNGTLTYAQTLRDRNFVAMSVRRTF